MSGAFLRPSAAHIWGRPNGCTLYPSVVLTYPDTSSDASAEGTATHEVAAHLLALSLRGESAPNYVGTVANNGVLITEGMLETAERYVEVALSIFRRAAVFTAAGEFGGVEQKLVMYNLVHPLNEGTPDAWLLDQTRKHIHIVDLKAGYGIVEAFENWQLADYAAGVVEKLGILGGDDVDYTVFLHIVQPNAYHREGPHRIWSTKLSDLRAMWNSLKHGGAESLSDKATARTGDYCFTCPARLDCSAFTAKVYNAIQYARMEAPETFHGGAVGLELHLLDDAIRTLKGRKEATEAEAELMRQRGEIVPGVRFEQQYGRRKWLIPDADVLATGVMLGVDLSAQTPVSPAQAEKLGLNPDTVRGIAKATPSKMSAVLIKNQLARRIFEND